MLERELARCERDTAITTTTTSTTTTTVPVQPGLFVRVTSICRGGATYTMRVRNESATSSLTYNLTLRDAVITGLHTIDAGEVQFYEIPNADTVISNILWIISTARQLCTEVYVTGASATARPWAVRVNLGVAPWYGSPTNRVQTNGTAAIVVESAGSLLLTGLIHGGGFDPRTNNTPLTNQRTALVTICNYNNPPPPATADPSWYTVTQTRGVWTATQACVVVTATTTRSDLGSSPFFFGWTTTVDLAAAKARIVDAGRTLNFVGWSPYPNGVDNFAVAPGSFNPPQDTYAITSGFDFALRPTGGGADSRSTTVCIHGW